MYIVQQDMRDLKEKASVERHKAKSDAKLLNLEHERDWFRREALDLDKMNKNHKLLLNELKTRYEAVAEDKTFLNNQLVEAKMINKSLMFELDRYKKQYGDLSENPAITAGGATRPAGAGLYSEPTMLMTGKKIFETT